MNTQTHTTMHAIRVHVDGGPEALVYEDVPRPTAGPGEVLIGVHAAGVNPADLHARSGFKNIPEAFRKAIPPVRRPGIPGLDVSGVVEEVGPGVTAFQPGDAVYGMLNFPLSGNAYAEYTTASVADLALKPRTIDHVHAAAIPMAALTAWQLLIPDLEAGQTVLVNGAAGGVGHFAVQLAKLKGAHVIGVASRTHAEFLLQLGVDTFIDYTAGPIQVTHAVDIVFDTVGGENTHLLSLIKRGGRLIPITISYTSPEQATAAGVTLGTSHGQRLYSSGPQLAEIANLIDAGQLRVAIDTVVPLPEAYKAHQRAEAGHVQGKIVLRVVA